MGRKATTYPNREVALGDASGLSARQSQILLLIQRGLTYHEIADRLGISAETVKHHVIKLEEKFCVHDRPSLVSQAWLHGVLQPARTCRIIAFALCVLASFPLARNVRNPPKNGKPVTVQVARIHRHEIAGVLS